MHLLWYREWVVWMSALLQYQAIAHRLRVAIHIAPPPDQLCNAMADVMALRQC